MPYSSVEYTLEDLFGSRRKRVVYDFPCNIGFLEEKLKKAHFSYSADELIRKHTLFPLYENFIPAKLAKNIYQRMLHGARQSIQSSLGLTSSNVPMLQYLKFCPECCKESMDRFGELYIRRVHQNQCVDVCPSHEVRLISSNINLKRNSQRGFICPEIKELMGVYPVECLSGISQRHLIDIAKSFDLLLEGKYTFDFHELRSKYLHLAKERKLLKSNNSIDVEKLKSEFVKFYGEKLLVRFGSVVDGKANNWLPAIFRHPIHLNHPIRHILVMIFLAGSIELFCRFAPDGKIAPKQLCGMKLSINKCSRINWDVRDRETLPKVKSAVKAMLFRRKPFVRLTVHSVCSMTDEKDRILKSLKKLPMTKSYLESVIESHIAFQYRKIHQTISEMSMQQITKASIYQQAAIVKYRYKEIDTYIDRIIADNRGDDEIRFIQ